MEDNMVLVVLIIALMITTISVLIYYEDYNETEFEKCIEGCNNIYDDEREVECKINCINHFSNCSTTEAEG